jgi:uncharacterized protein YndB with AHSA1/START domain
MGMAGFEFKHGYDLDLSPVAGFSLIATTEGLKRWFAKDATLDQREGGSFTFAGRGAYAPTSTRVTRYEPNSVFGFDWPVHGVTGTVQLSIMPVTASGKCRAEVICRFTQTLPIPRGFELADDLWRFWMGNLKTASAGEESTFFPDFSDPKPEIRQSILINAPRDRVFRALIVPEAIAQWAGGAPVIEPHVGGRYSYGWVYEVAGKKVEGGPTRIIELVENERLVTDWPDWRGDSGNNGQKITWLLADEGAGTRLTLIHDGFSRPSDFSDYPFGWADYLGAIKEVVEKAV